MPITRLFTTVLLPTCPLPDCILLFRNQQALYHTVYYCSATHRPNTILTVYCSATHRHTARLITTVLLQKAHYQTVHYWSATYRSSTILYTTFCYQHAHYQTVHYWSATYRSSTILYTTVLLPTCPLPDCILLFCYQHAHYQTVNHWSAIGP